jgi:hypothetical protein
MGALWVTWYSLSIPPPLNYVAGGNCIWRGFPSVTLAAAATLHCIISADGSLINGSTWEATISVSIGGTVTTLATLTASSSETDHTMTIPSGTDLSTIQVQAVVTNDQGPTPLLLDSAASGSVTLNGFEIYIQ